MVWSLSAGYFIFFANFNKELNSEYSKDSKCFLT